ncbi:MAG: ImmA/IrrE family metallo-endopeptidase [Gemmataceae bacterium]
MLETVDVKPELIRWAIERSGLPFDELAERFAKLAEWRTGERKPTFKQLEDFAKRTMTPFGYLFLDEPPAEKLEIPDFRTKDDRAPTRPSPNLIDTLHDMQRRQQWMREYLIEQGQEPLPFIGQIKGPTPVKSAAERMRETLGLDEDWAEHCDNWEIAVGRLREAIERIGILVSITAVVGLNNTRKLDPDEFRGFVLIDDYAPLIFVNGADSKSAQMFTLAHELAHVWIGKAGLFNLVKTLPANDRGERFCNEVAAEFLVPAKKFAARWAEARAAGDPFRFLSRVFKVSPVVAARRALDLHLISEDQFFAFYRKDQAVWQERKAEEKERKRGPSFYVVQDVRLGRRFAFAVYQAVREGRLLYGDAYRLTDLKGDTFNRYADFLLQRVKDEWLSGSAR